MHNPLIPESALWRGRIARWHAPWRQEASWHLAMRRLHELGLWLARAQQRKALAELDEHLLRDLGLSDEDVRREVAKPFWR